MRPSISLTLSPDTLKSVDEQRGMISRSRYVEMMLSKNVNENTEETK